MKSAGAWSFVVVVGLLLVGCDDGGDDDGSGSADAAPMVDAMPPPPPDAAPAPDAPPPCHAVANQGSPVPQVAVAEVAPTPMGGPIPPGTYVITAWKVYTGLDGAAGETGNVINATSQNDGANFDYVEVSPLGVPTAFSGTYSTMDDNIMINIVCPAASAGPSPYDKYTASSSPDEFTIFDDTTFGGATVATTYTKLP